MTFHYKEAISRYKIFLETLVVTELLTAFAAFIIPENSPPFSHKLVIRPYPKHFYTRPSFWTLL